MTQKCGVVTLIGAPNAGKSTLINALVGQKVAITSAKPQTTRGRLMGIAMDGDTQILLNDTPGIFEPRRRLDRSMVSAAWEGADSVDVLVFLIDGKAGLGPKVTNIAEKLANHPARKILVLNKVDIATKERLLPHVEKLHALAAFEETFFISALTGDGLEQLRQWLMAAMPEGAWHYPEDQASDVSQRLMAAEITREQIFQRLHAELPYAAAVTTEKYSERADGSVEIHQQILIERSSQRAIILGKGGQQLRSIGEAARKEIADLLGSRVHLYLHVKVSAKWTEDRSLYRDMGMDWVD